LVAEHIAFLIDENLTPGLVEMAHDRGFNAYHAAWVGLSGAKDFKVASYAVQNSLILVTNDLVDFRRIYKRKKYHPGVIFLAVVDGDVMDRQVQRLMFEAGLDSAEADEPMYALDKKVDAALLIRKGVALFGTPDEIGEAILKVKEQCGYEDFMFHAWFETGGFRGEEIETQMQYFAEEVMPGLGRACGGQMKNPEIGVDFASPNGKGR
jgi:predicted nuclease of predicted toxin-antitoxin system